MGTTSYDDDAYIPGEGWVLFAGTMLALLGGMNLVYGIAAVSNSEFFVADARFVFSNLNTWGWVMIVISLIQLVAAFGVWMRWKGIRWIGVAIGASTRSSRCWRCRPIRSGRCASSRSTSS